MGPRAGLDRCGKSRPPPGFDPRHVILSPSATQLVSHHLYAKTVRLVGTDDFTWFSSCAVCVSYERPGLHVEYQNSDTFATRRRRHP